MHGERCWKKSKNTTIKRKTCTQNFTPVDVFLHLIATLQVDGAGRARIKVKPFSCVYKYIYDTLCYLVLPKAI